MRAGDVVAERFELESLAATGGMGVVWKARDRHAGAPVALKILQTQSSGRADRFQREARVLAELSHPGIVRYIAHGTTMPGEQYLAMEWLEGEDLSEHLAREQLSVADSIVLAGRVAEALAIAHSHGIVHRDIKPSNLFLPDADIQRVKILDFGVARFTRALDSATRTGNRVGTPRYMAPEQVRGAKDLDARADVFALACVLYACLVGRPAFVGEDEMAVLAKILLEEPPRVSELRTGIPRELEALLVRMLSKDRKGRPKDGAAVAAELALISAVSVGDLSPARSRSEALTEGEQRLLSVILVGRQDRSPENPALSISVPEWGEMAQRTRELTAAAHRHGARLEELADGSVVVTVAGRGMATDQAAQASRCALAMRAIAPHSPMALATGRGVVLGRLPVGEVLDRAARIMRAWMRRERSGPAATGGVAASAAIPIDEVTAGLLDTRFDVGGDDDGLLLRAERDIAEFHRTLLGRPSACVGRERDLGILVGIFDECVSEPVARAVLITAPAGVGKSRLRYEFLRKIRQRGESVEILIGRGDPMRAGSPFGMIAPALRRTAGVLDGEPLDVRRRKLAARAARHVPVSERPRVAEFLGELVGIPFPDEDSVQLRSARKDAMLMGDQMRRAWEDWLAAECDAQPVLVVLEDLHWGDVPTVKFIDSALRNLEDCRLMVLALSRPEVHDLFPKLWAGRPVTDIQLGQLTRKASEKLIREALGKRATPEVIGGIVERAQGNAFFLEELTRSVAESGETALPGTVLAMLQARLESLPAEARRVLRAGSVFGQVFWHAGVVALLGGEGAAAQADEWLQELVEREVITRRTEGRFPGQVEHVFRHALLRDASYAMLTDRDLALGHRLAGKWLEQVGESDAMLLAEHFERGQEPTRAIAFFRRAAEQALEGHDIKQVIIRAERGLSLGATGDGLGALKHLQAMAHEWCGDNAEAETCGLEAMKWLRRGSPLWYDAAAEVAMVSGRLGNYKRLLALSHALLEMGNGSEATGSSVIALCVTASELVQAGQRELADALLARARETGAEISQREPAARGWLHRVQSTRALILGDPAACLHHAELSAQSFAEAGDLRNAWCTGQVNAGLACLEIGDYAQAERALRDALATAERLGVQQTASVAKQYLGLALARMGSLEQARLVETSALEEFTAYGDQRCAGMARIYLAQILEWWGDLGEAEREARGACELLRPAPRTQAHALAVLSHVLLAGGRTNEARATSAQALAMLEALGGIDEGEVLLRLVDAQARRQAGDKSSARAAILEARDKLLARAEKIGDTASRQSFLERVPENALTLELARDWFEEN